MPDACFLLTPYMFSFSSLSQLASLIPEVDADLVQQLPQMLHQVSSSLQSLQKREQEQQPRAQLSTTGTQTAKPSRASSSTQTSKTKLSSAGTQTARAVALTASTQTSPDSGAGYFRAQLGQASEVNSEDGGGEGEGDDEGDSDDDDDDGPGMRRRGE